MKKNEGFFFEGDLSLLELQSKIDFDMNKFYHPISNHFASSNDLRLKYVNQKMKKPLLEQK